MDGRASTSAACSALNNNTAGGGGVQFSLGATPAAAGAPCRPGGGGDDGDTADGAPPSQVGHYRLLQSLGKGNFAVVRLAKHKIAKTKVAVKIVARRKLDRETVDKLNREVDILKRLNHPHVIRFYEIIEVDDTLYIVTEYASGGELFNLLLSRGRMCERDARRIFRQASCALAYCHAVGVAHRDLKAENLLFMDNGDIKLIDFGFGQHHTPGALMNTWCGSPPYAAPELFQGVHYDGTKADIWSLGVILYVLVTGGFPFPGDCIDKLKMAVMSGCVVIPYWVSVECADLIRKMLEVSPRRRIAMHQILSHRWYTDASDWSSQWAELAERSLAGLGDDPDEWRQPAAAWPPEADAAQAQLQGGVDVNLAVLAYMQQRLSVPADVVKNSVHYGRFDELHGCYRILCDKLARQTPLPHGREQRTAAVPAGRMPMLNSRRMTVPALPTVALAPPNANVFSSRRGSRGSIAQGTASPDGAGAMTAVISASDFAKLNINSSPEPSDDSDSEGEPDEQHRRQQHDTWYSLTGGGALVRPQPGGELTSGLVRPHGLHYSHKRRRPSLPVSGHGAAAPLQLPPATAAADGVSVAACAWLSPGSLARPAMHWSPETLNTLAAQDQAQMAQGVVPFPLHADANKCRRMADVAMRRQAFDAPHCGGELASSSTDDSAQSPSTLAALPYIVTTVPPRPSYAAPAEHPVDALREYGRAARRASDGGAFVQLGAQQLRSLLVASAVAMDEEPATSGDGSSDIAMGGGLSADDTSAESGNGPQLTGDEHDAAVAARPAGAFLHPPDRQSFLPHRTGRMSFPRGGVPSISTGLGGLRRASSPLQLTQTQLAALQRTYMRAAGDSSPQPQQVDIGVDVQHAADSLSPQVSPNDRPPSPPTAGGTGGVLVSTSAVVAPLDMIMEQEPPVDPAALTAGVEHAQGTLLVQQAPPPIELNGVQYFPRLYGEAPSMHMDAACQAQSHSDTSRMAGVPLAMCAAVGGDTLLLPAMAPAQASERLVSAARHLGVAVFDCEAGRRPPCLCVEFVSHAGHMLKAEIGVTAAADCGAAVHFRHVHGDPGMYEMLRAQLSSALVAAIT